MAITIATSAFVQVQHPMIPIAVSLKMRTTQTGSAIAVCAKHGSTSRGGHTLIMNNTGNTGKLRLYGKTSGGSEAVNTPDSTTVVNTGAWFNIAYNLDYANNGANTLYINGTQEATFNAVLAWGGTLEHFNVGKVFDNFWTQYTSDVAEVAVYGSQLTTGEIAALAKDISPLKVAPQKLIAYLPLIRDIKDHIKDGALVTSGTLTPAVHPRIIY